MGVSVIIPTFDNIEFIDETLTSIYNSGKDFEYEILIGIDGCNKSLKYLKDKSYPLNILNFYYNRQYRLKFHIQDLYLNYILKLMFRQYIQYYQMLV